MDSLNTSPSPLTANLAEPTVAYHPSGEAPITIEVSALPPASVSRLLRLGMTAYFGNNVSAKISQEKKKVEAATGPMDEETLSKLKAELTAEALDDLWSGDFSTARAPRGTAIDTIFNGLVEAKTKTILQLNRLTMPTGEKTIAFPDGHGGEVHLSRTDLLARVAKRYGDTLRAEAEEIHRRRIADAEAALRASEGATGLESLGF